VEARIDRRYDPNEAGALRTRTHQHFRSKSNRNVGQLTCWHCGTRSLVLGWHLCRYSSRIRNQWLRSLSISGPLSAVPE
jgi:hypothetical protein